MKRITPIGLWKAIAFLTAASLFVSCDHSNPPTVKTVNAWMTNDSVISAYGSVVSDGGSYVISYGFCISADNTLPTVNDTKLPCSSNNGSVLSNFSTSISGLKPNTQYYIRAYAINDVGVAYGDAIMAAISAKPSISEVSALGVSDVEATLSAVFNPQNTTTEGWFEWGEKGTANTHTIQIPAADIVAGKAVSVKISGLSTAHTYWFTAKASNQFGETDAPIVIFNTCVKDWDGNLYELVTIGSQTWLKSNFKGTHFANGDPIPNVTDTAVWKGLTTPAYCNYNNSEAIAAVYGRLYNWYVASDARGLIPGWHVATGYEWGDLCNSFPVPSAFNAGKALMEAGSEHWINTGYKSTNSTGFTALPNGLLAITQYGSPYTWYNINEAATFWTSSEMNGSGNMEYIQCNDCTLSVGGLFKKQFGCGIRLIKNQ